MEKIVVFIPASATKNHKQKKGLIVLELCQGNPVEGDDLPVGVLACYGAVRPHRNRLKIAGPITVCRLKRGGGCG